MAGLEPFQYVTINCIQYILVFAQLLICLSVRTIYKKIKHQTLKNLEPSMFILIILYLDYKLLIGDMFLFKLFTTSIF